MTTEMTAEQYTDQMEQLARDAFALHEGATKLGGERIGLSGAALHWDGGRVFISRPGSGFYATEFVWLRFGRMLIHGDIAPVIVSVSSTSFREAVHEFATGTYIDYFAGKVSQGEGNLNGAHTCAADVFASQLRAEMQSPDESYGALVEALRMVEADGDLDGAKRALWEANFEDVHHYGRVVAPRVFYAHAALKRLDAISGWRCPACDGRSKTKTREGGIMCFVPCAGCNGTGTVPDRPARASDREKTA